MTAFHLTFLGLVRFSWSTAKVIMDKKGPEVTWEDDNDDDDVDQGWRLSQKW